HDVPADHIWLGAGTSELIAAAAAAVGGPGTSAVYGRPSFVMYKIATTLAGSDTIPVGLDDEWRLELGAMAAAARPDTSALYVCNPNNPTGTHVGSEAVEDLINSIPDEVLVLVDEAYFEFVEAGDYASAIPMAIERPNVLVTRTFSKVYGLAGLRIGYAVCRPETISELQKAQIPFSVNVLAQVAALESLRHQERVVDRVALNREGRTSLRQELTDRGIPVTDSQANFLWCRPSDDSMATAHVLKERGVIVRPFHDGWQRVTVGTPEENLRFLEALSVALTNVRS
ncbi:MAG TPA: histidinol-phosphate transaminase, partial [Acidimicrobiia bacterium]